MGRKSQPQRISTGRTVVIRTTSGISISTPTASSTARTIGRWRAVTADRRLSPRLIGRSRPGLCCRGAAGDRVLDRGAERLLVPAVIETRAVDEERRRPVHAAAHAVHEVVLDTPAHLARVDRRAEG